MNENGQLAQIIDLNKYRRAKKPTDDFMEFLQRFDDVTEEDEFMEEVPICPEIELGESFWHSFYNSDD